MMKRSYLPLVGAALLFLAAVTLFSRTSYASRSSQGEPAAPAAVSAVSPVFSYQGQLTNTGGTPVTNAALPVTFRLFPTLTAGTACWTESQNVNVQNGQFSVLLGQLVAIPAECATESPYLELTVNGETMTPREALVSVAAAVTANSLTANAQTAGPLAVEGELSVNNELIANPGLPDNALFYITNNSGGMRLRSSRSVNVFIDTNNDSSADSFGVYRDGNDATAASAVRVFGVDERGNLDTAGAVTSTGLTVNGGASINNDLAMDGERVLRAIPGDRSLHLMPWFGPGQRWDDVCVGCGISNLAASFTVNGRVNANSLVVGTCRINAGTGSGSASEAACENGSITSGAYIEANLMTNEERAADIIDRFEQGDLLCWSAGDRQLEKCAAADDPLVMGVADADGKPIVLGAEQIKVIGPVVAGDYLVASDTPGYAQASDDPSFGIVIGQALEDFDGSRGLILAMIRKM